MLYSEGWPKSLHTLLLLLCLLYYKKILVEFSITFYNCSSDYGLLLVVLHKHEEIGPFAPSHHNFNVVVRLQNMKLPRHLDH